MSKPHRHKEAFALMWYACDECGHRERIWNSRDGVTPFGTGCPSCGRPSLFHADWQRDEVAPNHKPHRDQRYFRDGTVEEALAVVERRIKSFQGQGTPVPADIAESLRREAREQTGDWQQGWPTLDRAGVLT